MSEVYKFAAMSEVETMEAPTDSTTLLAVEGDAVKQIPASSFGTGGNGSGGGGFAVMGTIDMSTYAITADKTYEEITAAVERGCAPVFVLSAGGPTMFMPLIIVDELGAMHFALTHPTYQLEVSCTAENVWAIVPGD